MTQYRLDAWDAAQTDINEFDGECSDCTADLPCFEHYDGGGQ